MGKLNVFLLSLIGIFASTVLFKYQFIPVSHQNFDYVKEKEKYEEQLKLSSQENLHHEKSDEEAEVEVKAIRPIEIPLDNEALKLGFEVYNKKGKCTTCHGINGEGKASQKAPVIAGQYSWYLAEQLHAMKSRKRINEKMQIYLKSLTDEDLNNVAEYVSKLPWPGDSK